MRTQELAALATAFVAEHTDMAVERLDGEEADVQRLRESLHSLPFLTTRKLVILREPGKQKAFAEAIADILADVPETTDVVLVEPKLDKRQTYYKVLKKQTDFREYTELDAPSLARWAVTYAQTHGGSLGAADARTLVDRIGANQQLLAGELDKLLLYAPAITRQTIELLTEQVPQSTIFDLLDAALAGKAARALGLYQEQRALKVEPQAVIALLAWQLHALAVVAAGQPRSADDIAREAKLNPYVVRKSQALARRLGLPRLKLLIEELLRLDVRLKRASLDADEAVQLYLLKLGSTP